MKIGLYFGSFNPIHNGHLFIADYIARNQELDEVWLIVSPQNPFKTTIILLNENIRLQLAKLAIENNNKLKISSIEFKLPKPSYTIDTLLYLEEKYPEHNYSIIIGSDNFRKLPKWKNADVLLNKYRFIVYNRPRYKLTDNIQENVTTIIAPQLNISSTIIRKLIKEGNTVRYLVPDNVCEEIVLNDYYK